MRNIFKRRRRPVPPVPTISFEDRLVAAHWGYTFEQWADLPALVRVDKREGFYQSKGLAS